MYYLGGDLEMQSKKGSFIEAIINTLIGYLVTLAFSPFIYKIAGVKITVGKLNLVVFLFTLLSVARSYVIRRFFNKVIIRAANNLAAPASTKFNQDGSVTVTLTKENYHDAGKFKGASFRANLIRKPDGSIVTEEYKDGLWVVHMKPEN